MMTDTQASAWIPVTERMPAQRQNVLAVFDRGKYKAIVGCAKHSLYYNAWRTMFGRSLPQFYTVTHWQPLPELPREDAAMFYIANSTTQQIIEITDQRPTLQHVGELARADRIDLYVIEGEHADITYTHLESDSAPDVDKTWRTALGYDAWKAERESRLTNPANHDTMIVVQECAEA